MSNGPLPTKAGDETPGSPRLVHHACPIPSVHRGHKVRESGDIDSAAIAHLSAWYVWFQEF